MDLSWILHFLKSTESLQALWSHHLLQVAQLTWVQVFSQFDWRTLASCLVRCCNSSLRLDRNLSIRVIDLFILLAKFFLANLVAIICIRRFCNLLHRFDPQDIVILLPRSNLFASIFIILLTRHLWRTQWFGMASTSIFSQISKAWPSIRLGLHLLLQNIFALDDHSSVRWTSRRIPRHPWRRLMLIQVLVNLWIQCWIRVIVWITIIITRTILALMWVNWRHLLTHTEPVLSEKGYIWVLDSLSLLSRLLGIDWRDAWRPFRTRWAIVWSIIFLLNHFRGWISWSRLLLFW